jgi:hypothetical protein
VKQKKKKKEKKKFNVMLSGKLLILPEIPYRARERTSLLDRSKETVKERVMV